VPVLMRGAGGVDGVVGLVEMMPEGDDSDSSSGGKTAVEMG
jgi:hypothetical protein